jgi:hypothetical protein
VTWIDLNNDGDKDSDEAETSFSKLTAPGDNITESISLHIPSSTPLGFQIIRTVCSYANSPHPNSTSSDAVTITEVVVISPPSGGGVSVPSVVEEVEEVEEGIPERLFDISFILDDSIIGSSDELSAVVTFENFGTQKTLVELMFIIFDDEDNRVYEEGDYIVVETEGLLRKSFEGLDLDYGKYVIVMETLYGDDVFDEFRQDFEITREAEIITCPKFNWISYPLLLIIFVLLVWIIILKNQLRKAREKRAGVWGKGVDVLGKGVVLIRRWAIGMLEKVIRLMRKGLIDILGGRIKPLK